jgi:hypothetical protein
MMDDYSNCCMMERPLERHTFAGAGEECDICGRMRAFHQVSDFHPSTLPHVVCMEPNVRYRGGIALNDRRCGMKGNPRLSREEFLKRKLAIESQDKGF